MLEKYIEIDDKQQELLEQVFPRLISLREKTELKKSVITIIAFIGNTNFIKNGIFDLYESQNIYSIKILFRSLIEHYLKFQYLFLRFIEIKNDSVFSDYEKFSKYSEMIYYGDSIKNIYEILNGDTSNLNSFETLKELYPELNEISRKSFKNKVNEYKIFNIIKFINNKINKENTYSGNKFLLDLLPIYSELSSFVHGGFEATQIMSKLSNEDDRIKDLDKSISFSLNITLSIASFSCLMFAKHDKTMVDFHNKFYSLLKRYANDK